MSIFISSNALDDRRLASSTPCSLYKRCKSYIPFHFIFVFFLVALIEISMSSTRPGSRSRRIKSATARMITPPDPSHLIKPTFPGGPSVKEKDKRVDSAKLNREKNESSKKVFPPPSSNEKNKERYRSIYNKDFEGTYMTPLEPRPTSPTRRNNPHPSHVSTDTACITQYESLLPSYSNSWYGGYPQERLVLHS